MTNQLMQATSIINSSHIILLRSFKLKKHLCFSFVFVFTRETPSSLARLSTKYEISLKSESIIKKDYLLSPSSSSLSVSVDELIEMDWSLLSSDSIQINEMNALSYGVPSAVS